MNAGLANPEFVFFFVSHSLKSKMVELEWQNALLKSTKGHCRIIPVRVDGCSMPPLLLQNLYIDMFAHGIEATIVQLVNVIQGNNTFTPQHLGFSNLTYRLSGDLKHRMVITIAASHLMEPNPDFLVLVGNTEQQISIQLNRGEPFRGGFNENVRLDDGTVVNAHAVSPLGGAITPQRTIVITLEANGDTPIQFIGILHKKTQDRYESIPLAAEQYLLSVRQ